MTTEEIERRVENIKIMQHDYEAAHALEDTLRLNFIKHIASLNLGTLSAKAKLVASTEEIPFMRSCA